MNKKLRVLVYPCGTEIGLEIHRALKNSTKYELIGGSSSYDHGRFVYKNHIDNLPFISDKSKETEIEEFNKIVVDNNIDIIYPAMDGVITIFSKYRKMISPILIAPDEETTSITRSKKLTYDKFEGLIPVPKQYSMDEIMSNGIDFPIFIKPDVGQGSVGTAKINSIKQYVDIKVNDSSQLDLEYLPGNEYTIDCFTNNEGKLVFCKGRTRKRIRNGISVNAVYTDNPIFEEYARIINAHLNQRGAWFYQLKEDKNGNLKLLEIASRIAGTSAITRNIGVNLPLLTLNTFIGVPCNDVIVNDYDIELDRALENKYKTNIHFNTVYIDYDDTVVVDGIINTNMIKFIVQCINNKKIIVLLTKHDGDIHTELKKYRILDLFDEIVHIDKTQKKKDYIKDMCSIFIDDSYGERKEVHNEYGINVFDINTIECLMED